MSKDNILEVAYVMAQRDGFGTLTRDGVAAEAGVAMGSVNHHYGTMDALRDAVMRMAIEREDLPVIAQGIAAGHPIAQGAPLNVRTKALATLL